MIEPYNPISTSIIQTQIKTFSSPFSYYNKAAPTSADDTLYITVTTTTSNVSTTGVTTYLCNWEGHCVNATCHVDDDCASTKPYGDLQCYKGHCVADIPDDDSITLTPIYTTFSISTTSSSSSPFTSSLVPNSYAIISNTGTSTATTSNTIQSPSSSSSLSNSISTSSILGIVGGILALLLTIILLIVLFFKIKRRRMINSLSEIPVVQRKKGDTYELYSGHNSYQDNNYQVMQEKECRRAELAAN